MIVDEEYQSPAATLRIFQLNCLDLVGFVEANFGGWCSAT
jgi:hypothetical protein